jgi:deazaflavin-dependent oxidoreductase (nitroreductase family)
MPDWTERNAPVIEEFRANGGQVGGYLAGADLLLLTSTGAKSGRSYTHPLSYSLDGGRYVVAAADGGAPAHPAWYYNLVAYPDVTVEVGAEQFAARAELVTGPERERLLGLHASRYPALTGYQAKTTREIPFFVLERA